MVFQYTKELGRDDENSGQDVVLILCIIGIVYGSVIAIRQEDVKRLAAYSSFAHVGLIAAGVFALNTQGTHGAAIQMLAHGFNVVALFYIIDLIQTKTNTRNISELGGIAIADKPFAVLAFIIVLGSVAMPLTNAFVGEFLLLNGVFNHNTIMGAVAGSTIILGAVYMLRFYKKAFFGVANSRTENVVFLDTTATIILSILAAIVLLMGIFPQPFLDFVQ